MNGWLLDTNVIASLTSPNGAPSVRAWVAEKDENTLFISVLTLAAYDKGIHNLDAESPDRTRYALALKVLEARFLGRILPVSDGVVRRWGALSGDAKRRTGHAPSVIDTLLASTAIERDLVFVTRNVRDVAHSGASIFNPWQA